MHDEKFLPLVCASTQANMVLDITAHLIRLRVGVLGGATDRHRRVCHFGGLGNPDFGDRVVAVWLVAGVNGDAGITENSPSSHAQC